MVILLINLIVGLIRAKPMFSKIIATGSCVPERIVSNDELAQKMTTSDEWIRKFTGIRTRRFAAPGEGPSDLALKAAQAALAEAQLTPTDIDAIVFATSTPDYCAPGSGVLLQSKLNCKNIPAFEIHNTSSGFVFALDLADGLIKCERYRTVLTVGAEVHSTGLDFSDRGRKMSVIFGDGAGCVILQAGDGKAGLIDSVLHSDGAHYNKLWCEAPGSVKNPRLTKEQIDQGMIYPAMDGQFVFQHAVQDMSDVVREVLKKNRFKTSDVDWFLFHQANLRIIEAVGKNLGLPAEKVPTNIEKYGNTSSASLSILFDELRKTHKIKNGQLVVMTSFGSGFCWGSALLRV